MAADELDRPLGLTPPGRKGIAPRTAIVAAGVAAAILIAAGAGWMLLSAGDGGGTTATAAIGSGGADRTGSTLPMLPTAPEDDGIVISEADFGDMLGEPAATDEVVIYNPSDPPPMRLAAAPVIALVEDTADGPLPRIADSGLTPLEIYARPADEEALAGPRIAIVVGGIGIDPDATRNAIANLPGTVTLAFAPYGNDLSGDLASARAAGHEVMLQVPMEPFNYPMNDPGPNTLTLDADTETNIARLHWFLGRLTNYVGIVNYMGARFTGDSRALKPVIAEIGDRGLLWLDDGSSPMSRAAEIGPGAAPFLKADLVLDGDLSAASIDRQLQQLVTIAKERGTAIGTATAFPVTVDRVAAFVRAAASRGIAVVPVSALAAKRT